MANQTKAKIAETAFSHFLNKGYKKTTLREIAEVCGVTHANVLYHYKNKFDLGLLFQRRYLTAVDQQVQRVAKEHGIGPSVQYYALYWVAHYLFMLEYPSFAVFYEEFTNTNRQEVAADKLSSEGYVKMAVQYTGMEIAYGEPELSLNIYLLIEADVQIISALSRGGLDVSDALLFYLKNSLRLLVGYETGPAELLDTAQRALQMQTEIRALLPKIEQDLFVETAE